MSEKIHISIVVCGHVDAGKSTTTGHLLYRLGNIPEREMARLQDMAAAEGKASFGFAYVMDVQKEERKRGVTIACTTKEFFTDNYHYTIIDAPGHSDFILNMISGSSQADVALIMVPADGKFLISIQKGNRKTGEVPGQSRQHARLVNVIGVRQIMVGINKMDCDVANYGQDRFVEVSEEVKRMLVQVGFKKAFVDESIPIIPLSGFYGDNLLEKSTNMPWWQGQTVKRTDGESVLVTTFLDALNDFVLPPTRNTEGLMRSPVSGVYKIKGVGDVITGRVEQGIVNVNDEVVFLPTHSASLPCKGKVFSVEMHHKKIDQAIAGDNAGFNIKGLEKNNMPRVGDIMVHIKDNTLEKCRGFSALVQIMDIPDQMKVGYTPIGCVRCGRAPCRILKINWKMGKETNNQKLEDPVSLKSNEMAEIIFEPQMPIVVDVFANCEGLARIAFLDAKSAVMLGRITKLFPCVDEFRPAVSKKGKAK